MHQPAAKTLEGYEFVPPAHSSPPSSSCAETIICMPAGAPSLALPPAQRKKLANHIIASAMARLFGPDGLLAACADGAFNAGDAAEGSGRDTQTLIMDSTLALLRRSEHAGSAADRLTTALIHHLHCAAMISSNHRNSARLNEQLQSKLVLFEFFCSYPNQMRNAINTAAQDLVLESVLNMEGGASQAWSQAAVHDVANELLQGFPEMIHCREQRTEAFKWLEKTMEIMEMRSTLVDASSPPNGSAHKAAALIGIVTKLLADHFGLEPEMIENVKVLVKRASSGSAPLRLLCVEALVHMIPHCLEVDEARPLLAGVAEASAHRWLHIIRGPATEDDLLPRVLVHLESGPLAAGGAADARAGPAPHAVYSQTARLCLRLLLPFVAGTGSTAADPGPDGGANAAPQGQAEGPAISEELALTAVKLLRSLIASSQPDAVSPLVLGGQQAEATLACLAVVLCHVQGRGATTGALAGDGDKAHAIAHDMLRLLQWASSMAGDHAWGEHTVLCQHAVALGLELLTVPGRDADDLREAAAHSTGPASLCAVLPCMLGAAAALGTASGAQPGTVAAPCWALQPKRLSHMAQTAARRLLLLLRGPGPDSQLLAAQVARLEALALCGADPAALHRALAEAAVQAAHNNRRLALAEAAIQADQKRKMALAEAAIQADQKRKMALAEAAIQADQKRKMALAEAAIHADQKRKMVLAEAAIQAGGLLSRAIPKGKYVVGYNYNSDNDGSIGYFLGQPATSSVPELVGMCYRALSGVRLTRAEWKLALGAAYWGSSYDRKATSIQFTAWLYTTSDGSEAFNKGNAQLVASVASPSAKLAVRDISAYHAQPTTKVAFAFDSADPRWVLQAGRTYFLGISSDDTVWGIVRVPFVKLTAASTKRYPASTKPDQPAGCEAYPPADFCMPPLNYVGGGVVRSHEDEQWYTYTHRILHMDVHGTPAA